MAPFPSLRIPAQSKPDASRRGKSLELGRLISRVEPAYPDEVTGQRLEGTVKVHATIGRDGTIQSIVASGPQSLAEAAKKAVQQWRYKPTLLGGQPIEADQDIVFVFRLSAQGVNPK
jgi:periplasmic protein TonB